MIGVALNIRWRNAILHSEDGTAIIEAGLILPVFLFLLLGIFAFGIAVWHWNTMLLAVEEASRYVMINNSSCDVACAETRMQSLLSGASVCTTPTAGQICVSATTSAGPPSTMTLTAAYGFSFISLFQPFTITSQGTVPLD